jgi:uncharacterized protein YbjT (DUF2867 family)
MNSSVIFEKFPRSESKKKAFMKILVVGANGKIGKQIVEKIHSNTEHQAKAMVRDESQVEQFSNRDIDTVIADLEKDFEHAFDGCEAIIFTAGSGGHTGKDKTHLVDRLGAKQAVDYSVKKGIDRFVMISAFGADFSPSEWPDSMKHYYEAKADADKALMQTQLNYTILKPGRLTDEGPNHKVDMGEKTEKRGGSIPRTDVAEVAVKILDEPSPFKKTYELLEGEQTIDTLFR